jgi:hypothetical protein
LRLKFNSELTQAETGVAMNEDDSTKAAPQSQLGQKLTSWMRLLHTKKIGPIDNQDTR